MAEACGALAAYLPVSYAFHIFYSWMFCILRGVTSKFKVFELSK